MMNRREEAAEAVYSALCDDGYDVEEVEDPTDMTLRAGDMEVLTTYGQALPEQDIIMVSVPSEMNGEDYLGVYCAEAESVFFLPVGILPAEGQIMLTMSNHPSILDGTAFLDHIS